MAYIYKIINNINNKVYIGKTDLSIKQRWNMHKVDSTKSEIQNRPLYKAIQKYGIEHFSIEQIEQCDSDKANEREKYWIQYYNSYKDGYNATLGGDGKPLIDYNKVYNLYLEGKTFNEISAILSCHTTTIEYILESFGITKEQRLQRGIQHHMKPVAQIDKNTNEIIQTFPSIRAAQQFFNKRGHIAEVCKGKRKTAYGYKWKYI